MHLAEPWHTKLRRMRRQHPVYKVALLLSAIDLIDDGTATPEHIPLESCAARFAEIMLGAKLHADPLGSVHQPIYYLSTSSLTNNEPFLELIHAGRVAGQFENPRNLRTLLARTDIARFLPDLRPSVSTPEHRRAVRATICDLLERDGREECIALLEVCDRDRQELLQLIDEFEERKGSEFDLYDPGAGRQATVREGIVRDRALRRIVLPAYNHSCALCGLRIRWGTLYEVEAAHIRPRSEYGVDDPRNALSLCRTHHWAFDQGLWSATSAQRVVVRGEVAGVAADLEALNVFSGKRLTAPGDSGVQPHRDALEWHRENIFKVPA